MSEQAVRVHVNEAGPELDTQKICYWKEKSRGVWMIYFPHFGAGDLTLHTVEEHEDGTISVLPSILCTNHRGTRHGFLKKGIWEEV